MSLFVVLYGSIVVGDTDRQNLLENFDRSLRGGTHSDRSETSRRSSARREEEELEETVQRAVRKPRREIASEEEEEEERPQTMENLGQSLGLPPILDTNDPNYLRYTATNQNFSMLREPGGNIRISDGTAADTCIIILNIGDAAMSYFRQTFAMNNARYQNASNVDEAIQGIWNCQDAMGGPGSPVPHIVFATHGLAGWTQLGIKTSGAGTRKLIDALTGKPVTLTLNGITKEYPGREVPTEEVRFLSCLVAQGVGNGTHVLPELSAGLMGIRGKGPPKVIAWNQVMYSGPGHISSHGEKITIQAIDNRDETQIALNDNNDDAIGAENPIDEDDDEIMTETPVHRPRGREQRSRSSSFGRATGTSFRFITY